MFQCYLIYVKNKLLLVAVNSFSLGTAVGWSSPSIPKLMAADSPIPITIEESSWIAAFIELGVVIASLPAAWLMEK